jgi:conjugal transfer pilus assembly protein TraU
MMLKFVCKEFVQRWTNSRKGRCVFFGGCFLLTSFGFADSGRFVNPITDICWSCIFPIHVSGVNVTPAHKDLATYKVTPFCSCAGTPPKLGIPLAFWEPVALIDVTTTPYKLTAWGGATISKAGVRKRGTVANVGESGRSSFYNVHYYNFPVLHWLGLLTDFSCLESSELAVSYLSEFDPFWDDDQWASVLNPEVFLFSNPLAQAACIPDCVASSAGAPIDELFWCAGCMGSLYPFVGYVPHHIGGIQASYLLVHRLLGKLHSLGMGSGFREDNFCDKTIMPRIKKTIYKTQLVQPIANTNGPCQPLGKSDLFWGAGKSFPYGGEDFVYLIWTKKHCCLDMVKPAVKATTLEGIIP